MPNVVDLSTRRISSVGPIERACLSVADRLAGIADGQAIATACARVTTSIQRGVVIHEAVRRAVAAALQCEQAA